MRYLILLFVLTLACSNGDRPQTERANHTSTEVETEGRALHTITINNIPLKVEIAQDEEARAQGLMFREHLKEDEGMLFVFSEQRLLSFWMRNTFIPLDIAFINSDGIIVDIQRMEPLDESKEYFSREPALYALEVNAGWFKKHNIKIGDQVTF